jgi:deoxyribonuclease V
VSERDAILDRAVVVSDAEAGYQAGLLALREGALLERAVRALGTPPDVLLVNASGRDHPRRAGLALHIGAVVGIPTVGVTDRPLAAAGGEPASATGSSEPLVLEGEIVGFRVRTRSGSRPVCAHAAWRTEPETARLVVLAAAAGARTPQAIRLARFLARSARARDEGRTPPGWSQDRHPAPLSR